GALAGGLGHGLPERAGPPPHLGAAQKPLSLRAPHRRTIEGGLSSPGTAFGPPEAAMRKTLWLAGAILALAAPLASAAGINLAWNNCYPSAGQDLAVRHRVESEHLHHLWQRGDGPGIPRLRRAGERALSPGREQPLG